MSFALRVLSARGASAAVVEACHMWRKHGALIVEMTKREIVDRYAGSAIGGVWAILAPLLIIGANVFAYVFIFRIRMDVGGSGLTYAAFVLAAMVPWIALTDSVGRGTQAVTNSANLVKQIVFPVEILPLRVALSSLVPLSVGLAITIAVNFADGRGSLLGLVVLLPIALVSYLLMAAGFAYLLSAFGVFLRDTRDVVGVLISIGLFLHPIFYPPGAAPHALEIFFNISPISHLLWCFRDAIFEGSITRPWSWIIAPILSFIFFTAGWRFFRMLRPSFGNAL